MPYYEAATDELDANMLLTVLQGEVWYSDGVIEHMTIERVSNKQAIAKVRYVGEEDTQYFETNTLPFEE